MAIPIPTTRCHQSAARPCLGAAGARGRANESPSLIDGPMVAVAAAFALLFVVGLTATAWLVAIRPGWGSARTAHRPESSPSVVPASQEQEEISPLPASGMGGVRDLEAAQITPAPIREKPSLALRASKKEGDAVADPPTSGQGERPPVKSAPVNCQTFGTSVEFVGRPALAARLASQDEKLLYVLHVSGNFENDRFT